MRIIDPLLLLVVFKILLYLLFMHQRPIFNVLQSGFALRRHISALCSAFAILIAAQPKMMA
jgi:hypothetical protein